MGLLHILSMMNYPYTLVTIRRQARGFYQLIDCVVFNSWSLAYANMI